MYSRSYTGRWWQYYALGTFSWAFLGPVTVVEQTMNATGYLNIIADQLHPYMASVFPAGNGMFQQDNTPCHKANIVLEWFQEHGAEFQLTSWPPNSPDLNQIEHIWNVMGRQLRVQRPPIHNISDLRDRCLNTFGTICLRSSTKDLWHPCQCGLKLCCVPKMGQLVIDRWS
ncbi:transposase domain containing protein [Trichonephila clavipes]|nr:transposase domain containing protein [Trichonephila clavipes]